jgi:hypothetical protein
MSLLAVIFVLTCGIDRERRADIKPPVVTFTLEEISKNNVRAVATKVRQFNAECKRWYNEDVASRVNAEFSRCGIPDYNADVTYPSCSPEWGPGKLMRLGYFKYEKRVEIEIK